MGATRDRLDDPEVARLGEARAAGAGDAIDGVVPGLVLEPASPEQVAAALAWVSRERLVTVIRGQGTKLAWGARPAGVDVVLSMARLNRLTAHRHGDLTATMEAGTTLLDLNRQLAREGQWLPLDSAFDRSTIGGLVATNESGPLRHRYGTPRDLLIGITLALTDGRLVKSGGHVVKNVAGYDLGKLMSGSFGTFAAIVDITMKLLPIPAASETLVVRYGDAAALVADVTALASSQLEPTAFDLWVELGGAAGVAIHALHVRFATSPEATAAQTAAARTRLTGEMETLTGASESACWTAHVQRPWAGTGTVIRLAWLPASLPEVLTLLDDARRGRGGRLELSARAALGAGFVTVDADDEGTQMVVDALRARPDVVSNVVVLRHGAGLQRRLDVFGPAGPTSAILRSLKQTFDPAGVLNAGRGIV